MGNVCLLAREEYLHVWLSPKRKSFFELDVGEIKRVHMKLKCGELIGAIHQRNSGAIVPCRRGESQNPKPNP